MPFWSTSLSTSVCCLAGWQMMIKGSYHETVCSNLSLHPHPTLQCAASASEWKHCNPSDSWVVWECCPRWSPPSGNLPSAAAAPEASDSPCYLHIDWTRHTPTPGLWLKAPFISAHTLFISWWPWSSIRWHGIAICCLFVPIIQCTRYTSFKDA